jgi:hypothetical protein
LASSSFAAEFKPFFIQSIAPADEILADIDYITGVFDAAESGKMVRQVVGPYLGGIDKKRPSGAFVALGEGDEMIVLGFVPVTSLAAEFAILEETIGKPEDLGNGVFKIKPPEGAGAEGPEALFVTERDGWAFLAQDQAHLKDLPKDPLALLGGLHKLYDYGMRFDITGVPEAKRAEWLQLMRDEMEKELANRDPDANEEGLTKESMETVLSYVEGFKSFEFGMSIDVAARNVHLAI